MSYVGEPINVHHIAVEKLRDYLKDSQLENIKLHQEYGNLAMDLSYAMDLLGDLHKLRLELPNDIGERLNALFTEPF
jgi:hypothetical protein